MNMIGKQYMFVILLFYLSIMIQRTVWINLRAFITKNMKMKEGKICQILRKESRLCDCKLQPCVRPKFVGLRVVQGREGKGQKSEGNSGSAHWAGDIWDMSQLEITSVTDDFISWSECRKFSAHREHMMFLTKTCTRRWWNFAMNIHNVRYAITDVPAYSDTLGTRLKCHCKRGVTVRGGFY